jgi:hypothetical protein
MKVEQGENGQMKKAALIILILAAFNYLYSANFKDMTKLTNLAGITFGRLTVIAHSHVIATKSGTKHYWKCKCSCGNYVIVRGDGIKRYQSCGCKQREVARVTMTTHGDCVDGKPSREYRSWDAMKMRCYNPNNAEYKHYGARGIHVCKRWLNSYENFLADMGRCPEGRSLDRIENEKGYFPENCKWSTAMEQVYNRRNTLFCTYKGETKPLKIWCDELGLKYGTIRDRIRRHGYSTKRAFEKEIT